MNPSSWGTYITLTQEQYLAGPIATLDFETSIHNKGNPFDQRNFAVSVHYKVDDQPTQCRFYDEPDFKTVTRNSLDACSLLVGVNLKFDLHYCRKLGLVLPPRLRVWDCMLAEFILSGQTEP